MHSPILLAASCSLAFILSVTAARADETIDAESEARSVLEGYALNWLSLRQYDLFVVHEEHAIAPDGRSRDETHYHRCLIDHDAGSYLIVHSVEGERVDDLEKPPTRFRVMHAHCRDAVSQRESERWFPGNPKQSPILRSMNDSLHGTRCCDVRKIGSLAFPSDFSKGSIEESYQIKFSPSKAISETKLEDSRSRILIESCPEIYKHCVQTAYMFDTKRFVPIQMRNIIVVNDKPRTQLVESYQWKSIDDLFVPTDIHGERQFTFGEGVDRVTVPYHIDARFDWRVVNGDLPIDSQRFSEIVSDPVELIELLVPTDRVGK